MKGPLYLSGVGDENVVLVPSEFNQHLRKYQVDGVRFLYQCFNKKLNVVLNNDEGMNEPRQISALLTAISKTCPTLIVCRNASIPIWHYEFSKCNLRVVSAEELIKEDSCDSEMELPDAVIITHSQIKHLKLLPVEKWFIFVIEDIDLVINSRFIKNVNTEFRIAITTQNFLIQDNEHLQWNIMKWTNPKLIVEDKETFIKNEKFNKANFFNSFPEYWFRITWIIAGNEQPTDSEIQIYKQIIDDWCKRKKLKIETDQQQQQPTKRKKSNLKSNKRKTTTRQSKKKRLVVNEIEAANEEEISNTSWNTLHDDAADDDDDELQHNLSTPDLPIGNFNNKIEPENNFKQTSCSDTEEENDDILNSLLFQTEITKTNSIKRKSSSHSDYEIMNSDDESSDYLFPTTKVLKRPTKLIINKTTKQNSSSSNIDNTSNIFSNFNSQPTNNSEENNCILDSLLDDSQSLLLHKHEKLLSPVVNNESCPILDLLF